MPNWVYNGLTIEGNPEQVKSLIKQMNKPFVHSITPVGDLSFDVKQTKYVNPIFAFHNIYNYRDAGITDEVYHGQPPHDKTMKDWFKFEGNDWYNFNVREWGTKWDARDVDLLEDDETYLHYKFDTAWSPPTPAIEELSRQYPELEITLSYEEEGEWGGEIEYLDGEEVSVTEYDSPSSHKDYVDRDKEDNCVCGREEDKSEWYDDCPGAKAKEIKLFATKDVVILN